MSPLRIPAFRNLWLGQAISQLGDSFYFVIFGFMVQKITGSSFMVGFVSALEMAPYLLLSAYAGVVADRVDRRRIMLVSDVVSGGLLAGFALVIALCGGNPPVWSLFVIATTLSTARAFFMPAKSAAIPAIVPEDRLLSANALSAATQNFMPLISLSLSAAVIAVLFKISPTWFFATTIVVNMLSFLGSALFVAKLPPILPDRGGTEDAHPLQDLKDGVRFIQVRHELWVMLGLQLLLALAIGPFLVVYLAANKAWFGDQPQTLAWMEFSLFLGMVVGSALVGRIKVSRPGLAYVASAVGIGVAVIGMGFTPTFQLVLGWNVLAGLMIPLGSIPVSTYLQLTVPDAFRGRVMSAWTMVGMGAQPLGLALGGLLVEGLGIVGAFVAMGTGLVAAGALGLADGPFRAMKMPDAGAPVEGPLAVESA